MRNGSVIILVALTAAVSSLTSASPVASVSERYRDVAGRIIGAALVDSQGWERLQYLTDQIGNRLSGSAALKRAVTWAAEAMRTDGLEQVRTQPVAVPHWVRGSESLRLLEPVDRPLAMLGLGGSVATPPGGIVAAIVPVGSFEQLAAMPRSAVEGRMVLFNVPFDGYGKTVRYRTGGASAAARQGAVAALVRSVGPVSLQTPHTGGMRYAEDAERIPTAAITIEAAERIQRLFDRGVKVTARLQMSAQMLPDAPSANVFGQLTGSEVPDEIVVLGGHLDSWDVGQGAQDDGTGVIAAFRAVSLLKDLGLRPRRTIRVVLWTNEENGGAGGRAYRQMLGDSVDSHVAAIEMDGGSEFPVGFGFGLAGADRGGDDARYEVAYEAVREIGALLEGIGAGSMFRGGGGADIGPLMQDGVPGFGLRTVGEHYFDVHHTEADTLDKVDPDAFRRNIAALAVLAYVLADMPDRLGS